MRSILRCALAVLLSGTMVFAINATLEWTEPGNCVSDGANFIGCSSNENNQLTVRSAKNGSTLWTFGVGEGYGWNQFGLCQSIPSVAFVVTSDGPEYSGTVKKTDKVNGTVLWKFILNVGYDSHIFIRCSMSGDTVLVLAPSMLYALTADNGELKWLQYVNTTNAFYTVVEVREPKSSSLFFIDTLGLHRIDLESGAELPFAPPTALPQITIQAVSGEYLIVSAANEDNYPLAALNTKGNMVWNISAVSFSQVYAGVIVATSNTLSYGINATNGHILWRKSTISETCTAIGDGVVTLCAFPYNPNVSFAYCVGLDLNTGAQKWALPKVDANYGVAATQHYFFLGGDTGSALGIKFLDGTNRTLMNAGFQETQDLLLAQNISAVSAFSKW